MDLKHLKYYIYAIADTAKCLEDYNSQLELLRGEVYSLRERQKKNENEIRLLKEELSYGKV